MRSTVVTLTVNSLPFSGRPDTTAGTFADRYDLVSKVITATRLALAMGLSHSENSLYVGKPYETRPVNLLAKHTL
ncbi:hypothetical protein CEP51_000679 [Fusarium floridanum]|uniref:Uncharacterized protein n=2 Tax=Fusarium solani species complex TaxID=232080 RepID=A0A428SL14_9HYPO|nr:hypothetical protein CEP51_000679 [Fusarium floridanum]RSL97911.1 hypothetical protein CDV31_012810 [Fusarium ambrosium]